MQKFPYPEIILIIFYSWFKYLTLYEFNAWDEMGQAEAVWEGVHIGERWDEEHNIVLY